MDSSESRRAEREARVSAGGWQVASTVPASFVIDARDEFGNLKAAGGDMFNVRLHAHRTAQRARTLAPAPL